jgi:predicted nuclease of predicted toxin-antitoxin system
MLGIYLDHHVRREVAEGLRARGVDVLTAFEDAHHDVPDPELLDRATALGRVLFSQDDDLLVEAHRRQQAGQPFGGVVYAHQLRITLGECLADLELIAKTSTSDDVANQVLFLPL